MIRYALTCAKGHSFDGWFQSAAGFDRLVAGGLVLCADCGSDAVTKSLMAPAVLTDGAKGPQAPTTPLAPANTKKATDLAALRRKIEATSEYVGPSFAAEARAIHDGAAPERSIWGETRPGEAMALIAEGIPVAPLPFIPKRHTN